MYHHRQPIHRMIVGYDRDVTGVSADGLRITIDRADAEPLSFLVPEPAMADMLVAMKTRRVAEEEIQTMDSPEFFLAILDRLARGMLLAWHFCKGGTCLLSLHALSPDFRLSKAAVPEGPLRLSRFAWLRRDDDGLVLESSETGARVVFHHAGDETVPALYSGKREDRALTAFLWRAGFMTADGEAEPDGKRCWEFHDRLFHTHSRGLFDRETIGGAYRFRDRTPPPEALKAPMEGEIVALPALLPSRETPGLQSVMEARRSVREHGDTPLSLAEIGTFLHRTCRTITFRSDPLQDLLKRPHPGGGALYELECYVANWRGDGIGQGIFHYRSEAHCLVELPGTQDAAERIVRKSSQAMAGAPRPDVVIVITSRLPRLAWKYSRIAYRVTLLNAGVLLQSMYLTATDMQLAGCANGLGDHQAFHAAVDIDSWSETAVAEFALSSAPHHDGTGTLPVGGQDDEHGH